MLTVYSLRGLALPHESTTFSEDLDERLSMINVLGTVVRPGKISVDSRSRKVCTPPPSGTTPSESRRAGGGDLRRGHVSVFETAHEGHR